MPGPTGTKPSQLQGIEEELLDLSQYVPETQMPTSTTETMPQQAQIPTTPQQEQAPPQEELLDLTQYIPETRTHVGDIPVEQIDFTGEMDSLATRLRLSFAGNAVEQENELIKMFGIDNVKRTPDGIFWRENSNKKFKPFDSDKATLGDLADLVSPALQTGVDIIGTGAGAIAGGIAGLGFGSVPGAIAGGAVGGASAQMVNDFIAEEMLDIERDPNRSRAMEIGLSAAFGGILNGAFTGIGKAFAKYIHNVKLKSNNADIVPLVDKVDAQTKHLLNAVEENKGSQLLIKIPDGSGGQLKYTMEMLDSTNPDFNSMKSAYSTIKNKEVAIGKLYNEAVKTANDTLKLISDDIPDITKLNAEAFTGAEIRDKTVKAITKFKDDEGQLIGNIVKDMGKTADNAAMPAHETASVLDELFQNLGIKGLDNLNAQELQSAFPSLDKPTASKFTKFVQDLGKGLYNTQNGLTIRQLHEFKKEVNDVLYKGVGKTILPDTLGTFRDKVGKAITNEFYESTRIILGEDNPIYSRYRDAIKKYKTFAEARTQFPKLLEADNLLGTAFIDKIYKGGADATADYYSMKALVNEVEPKLWRELNGSLMGKILSDATEKGKLPFNFISWGKALDKYPPEIINDIITDAGIKPKEFRNMMIQGNSINKAMDKYVAEGRGIDNLIEDGVKVAEGAVTTAISGAKSIWNTIFKSKEARKLLRERGIDEFLGKVKTENKGKVVQMYNQIIALENAETRMGNLYRGYLNHEKMIDTGTKAMAKYMGVYRNKQSQREAVRE